jgi:Flp pilus assembly protein TadB
MYSSDKPLNVLIAFIIAITIVVVLTIVFIATAMWNALLILGIVIGGILLLSYISSLIKKLRFKRKFEKQKMV